MAPLPAPSKPKGHSKNRLSFEARPLLYRLTGVDLTEINGMSESTVLAVLSETGTDMSAWPSEKHFASWLALSPGTKVSGGKRLTGRPKVPANRAAPAFHPAHYQLASAKAPPDALYPPLR